MEPIGIGACAEVVSPKSHAFGAYVKDLRVDPHLCLGAFVQPESLICRVPIPYSVYICSDLRHSELLSLLIFPCNTRQHYGKLNDNNCGDLDFWIQH